MWHRWLHPTTAAHSACGVRLHGADCGLTPPWRVWSCKVHVHFWWKRELVHTMRCYRCGTSLSRLRMQNYRSEIIVRHKFGRIVPVSVRLAHPSPVKATTHCLQHSGCKSLQFGMKRVCVCVRWMLKGYDDDISKTRSGKESIDKRKSQHKWIGFGIGMRECCVCMLKSMMAQWRMLGLMPAGFLVTTTFGCAWLCSDPKYSLCIYYYHFH